MSSGHDHGTRVKFRNIGMAGSLSFRSQFISPLRGLSTPSNKKVPHRLLIAPLYLSLLQVFINTLVCQRHEVSAVMLSGWAKPSSLYQPCLLLSLGVPRGLQMLSRTFSQMPKGDPKLFPCQSLLGV